MTIDEIKELIRVVHETGIAELEVQRGEDRVRIRSSVGPVNQDIVINPGSMIAPASSLMQATPVSAIAAHPAVSEAAAQIPPPAPEHDSNVLVKSPIVGTYYDAPSPGSASFVKVGDQVEPGKVLCIIESMKLMNEIEAEVAGTVVAKLVENGRPVEYGEALFTIRPR
jgi:acetyl-CoA carboxylase biotin carboxyl carrier protein